MIVLRLLFHCSEDLISEISVVFHLSIHIVSDVYILKFFERNTNRTITDLPIKLMKGAQIILRNVGVHIEIF